jgi:Ca2+-dependent lipid-binding protein
VKGIVKINKISVRNLPKMDVIGKCDPFVVMHLGDEEKQTTVAYKTYNYDYENEEY